MSDSHPDCGFCQTDQPSWDDLSREQRRADRLERDLAASRAEVAELREAGDLLLVAIYSEYPDSCADRAEAAWNAARAAAAEGE